MTLHMPKRLGYWFNEKKLKKLSIPELEDALRAVNIEPVKIDLSTNLVSQGIFDVILHKLTDVISQADNEDNEARILLGNVKEYIKLNPETLMLDQIESIRVLTDRLKTYTIAENCQFHLRDSRDLVFIPTFLALQSDCLEENTKLLRMSKVTFPVVCKPIVAHGTKAHQMTLVFNEEGLLDCSFPCVVQSFVNHEAIIYKIFAIGDESFVIERPSIMNLVLPKDFPSIHFHSGDIESANLSIRQRMSALGVTIPSSSEKCAISEPDHKILQSISQTIGKEFSISLYGVDVVIDSSTQKYAIVDINVFPAYSGVEDFPRILAEYIRKRLDSPNILSQLS